MAASNYFYGLGRRKRATARVRLSSGKGEFVVNQKPVADYFGLSKQLQGELLKPFNKLELDPEKYSVSVHVSGGGHSSQAGAIRLGIAKALVKLNEDFRTSLRKAELLGRDSRERERKKFGLRSARKQRQFTKR
ncbi:30S ribosomal protein S9 [Candidatus Saccharibacteria bacterium]|nr:30S ribosomal protein S9 [Candidatus Saccharibacteria bacterium]